MNDLRAEYLELLAVGVPVPQAQRRVAEMARQQRATQPIPFHGQEFIGLGTHPDSLIDANDGVVAIASRVIADRLSNLEMEVMAQRRVRRGTVEEEVLDDHPLKALLDNPSGSNNIVHSHTRQQVFRLITHHLLTTGDAYLLKLTNALGIPERLFVMPPQFIEPLPERGLITSYIVTPPSGRRMEIAARDVVRIYFPDPKTLLRARSTLRSQLRMADLLRFQEEHLREHFKHDATPPTVIEGDKEAEAPDPDLKDIFEDDWMQKFHRRRGQKRGLPSWLAPGWHIKEVSAHGGVSQMSQLWEIARNHMLMAYGVPRAMVGEVVSGDRSSAEVMFFVFDRNVVAPLTEVITDAVNAQLVPDYRQDAGGARLIVRFKPFLVEDKEFELKREDQDLRAKVRSINKVLADRGDDPVPWGDLPVGSLADVPYTGEDVFADEGETDPDPQPEGDEDIEDRRRKLKGADPAAFWARAVARERAFVPEYAKGMREVYAVQRDTVLERLKGRGRSHSRINVSDIFSTTEWDELFEQRVEPVRRRAARRSGQEALEATQVEGEFSFTQQVQANLQSQAIRSRFFVNRTTERALRRVLVKAAEEGASVSQISARIGRKFGTLRSNATRIARTEILKASEMAQVEGFRQSGVVQRKQWNTSLDADVRDSHTIEGQIVDLDELFVLNSGSLAQHPGDGALPPEDLINCRCFVTPILETEDET